MPGPDEPYTFVPAEAEGVKVDGKRLALGR